MRKFLFVILFVLLHPCLKSQPIVITNNTMGKPLAQLIQAYPTGFSGLKGEMVDVGTQSKGYTCVVRIPGADQGVITRFDEGADSLFTWTDNLFIGENFAKAKQQFKKYFTEVKNTKFLWENKTITLQAVYEEPDENVGFKSILFLPEPSIESLKNVTIDLSLAYVNEQWQISASIYNMEK